MSEGSDSTAVRTALWRALHVLIDEPPHVLDDTIGLQIAGVDDSWQGRPDMNPERTSARAPVRRSWPGRGLPKTWWRPLARSSTSS